LGARAAAAADYPWLSPDLPDGTRAVAEWGALPGKRPLIELTSRPPNYEAPLDVFRTAITPSDRFFVRYHLSEIPDMASLRDWRLTVGGDAAARTATLSMDDLRAMPRHEVVAVCQCSGNRRGFSEPHVAGVEWGSGAMGCARWRGPRLRDVLARAGVKDSAVEIWLDGADHPRLDGTPDFRKALPAARAMADETIVAIEMNGTPLPLWNGYPARVVVPGWTSTYWMKHIVDIRASLTPMDNFWMQKAYRVPAGMFPVEHPFPSQDNAATWPITQIVVNSVIAGPGDGAHLPRSGFAIEGVAWDRGHGIRGVEVSLDDGKSWKHAVLGENLGPFAFRRFALRTGPLAAGNYALLARATNNADETQAETLKFNPAGYHNNVPRKVAVAVS
jgi:DMSO/TMAO reductase YedYZ molybdopterin-dependent catalytic subunit